jgi:hypothetical protein
MFNFVNPESHKIKIFILRAADINNLEFFKVISLQFFIMFPALRPLFKTVFKILNKNIKFFFTDDLTSPTSEKRFSFSTLLSFETARSQMEPSQESTADDPWQRCLLLPKTAKLKAKNVLAHCRGEESMSDLSTALFSCTSRHLLNTSM